MRYADVSAEATLFRTILVVAMSASVHTARWLNMVRAPDLRFVLMPVYVAPTVSALEGVRPVTDQSDVAMLAPSEVGVFDPFGLPEDDVAALNARIGYDTWKPSFLGAVPFAQPFHLATAIERFRPALVHSMEVQMAGYLCLATKQHLGGGFPPWLLSNWGSDIYLYRKLPDHQPRLRAIAREIDAYLSECRRDTAIIRQLGFRGHMLPPMPASGGARFESLPRLDELPRPSERREILVKGYHGWSGRGLHILSALQLAAPALAGYRIRITLAGVGAAETAAALSEATGLEVTCDPYLPSHADALARLRQARVVVSLGISDGISTTLLEAMAMGTFPIQASTSCCNEWFVDGETGFSVSPHDVEALSRLIARAASDDALVDAAAPRNRATVEERWNAAVNGPAMVERYRALLAAALPAAKAPVP